MTTPEPPDLRLLTAWGVERGELALEQEKASLAVIENVTKWFNEAPEVTSEQCQEFSESFDAMADTWDEQVHRVALMLEPMPRILALAREAFDEQRSETLRAQAQALETSAYTIRICVAVHAARAAIRRRMEGGTQP